MGNQKQKRINGAIYFFIALIVIYELASIIFMFTGVLSGIDVKFNIIISQSLIFVPTIIYLIITKRNIFDLLRLKKTNWLMIIIVPVIAVAIEPLTAVINALSMLFVDNQISDLSNELIKNNPFGISLLLMACCPAIVEETAYRGVILGSFEEGNNLTAVIMSGVLFGIMHMNLNQMAYAMVLGIIFAFLLEATGSILSTMLAHFCINGISVSLSYIVNKVPVVNSQADNTLLTRKDLLNAISVYLPFAVVGTLVAAGLIFLLAVLNNRKEYFLGLFRKKEKVYDDEPAKIVTPVLIIAMAVCIIICVVEEFILSGR
ncbi:MAG: lysostaphin resistance A-like protein [Coprococcus sp.]